MISTWKTMSLTLLVGITLTGCCQQEQAQIAALTSQNEGLMARNSDLQSEVRQLEVVNNELRDELIVKDQTIADCNERLAELNQELASKPEAVTVVADEWTATPYGDKIAVGSDILFAPGKATLTSKGKARLDKVVGDLKSTYSGLPVRVYGYTDSDPIRKTRNLWKDNLDLSANRAMAVTRYLRGRGVDAERVETVAMGATHFVAPNTTAKSKAKNRRVEIMVVK